MPQEFTPFKDVGLCFSGGGYRATFFSLGNISYLNRIQFKEKPLLEHVSAISSVSGGTILAVAFAAAAQRTDYSFTVFYSSFYTAFTPENDTLLKRAISKLEDDAVWSANPHKTRSIINAFALSYAEMDLFKGDFSVFTNPASTHLKEVCFNATDFSFGLSFRFQNGDGEFGNSPLKNTNAKALLPGISLGDIVASSSCFPVGFEPMLFPDNYCKDHTNIDYQSLKKNERFKEGVGIMDGGIADNQGITSMQLLNDRRDDDKKLDLIVVNDVSSFKMEPWVQQKENIADEQSTIAQSLTKIAGFFTVKPLYWLLLILGIIMIFSHFFFTNDYCMPCTSLWFYSIGLLSSGVGVLLVLIGLFLEFKKKKIKVNINSFLEKNVPRPILNEADAFKNLDISLVQRMLTNRMTSSVKMINEVFLKQIRRLNYKLLYSTPELQNKHITTTVYSLNGLATPYTGGQFKFNKDIKPEPSKKLTATGLIASNASTSLWWDKNDMDTNRMDSLIACGQFTMCYELIEYVLKLQKSVIDNKITISKIDQDALTILLKDLLKDWQAFNMSPTFMV